jgi:hypothetical protein
VNDHDTTVLTSRLHQLADDLTPPLDVVAQVRDARAGHHRRRIRIALLAAATATAVLLVGIPLSIGSLTSAPSGRVAGPGPTSSSSPTSAQEEADRRAVEEALRRAQEAAQKAEEHATQQPTGSAAFIPDGWEARSFLGVDFAVPPGARMADYVNPKESPGTDGGNTFIWNGPDAGGDRQVFTHIKVVVLGDDVPQDLAAEGYGIAAVRGTQQAFLATQTGEISDVDEQPFQVLDMGLEAWTSSGRHLHVEAVLPVGPVGEQMVRDLVASLVIR